MLQLKHPIGRSTSILLLMFCSILLGCDSAKDKTSQAPQGTPKTSSKPKVALIMKSLANEFFSTMADGAKKHQSEHSDQYELIVNGIKDERDLSRQSALVEEMVSSGVNAIVIAPADSKALIPALRRAQKAGIVVINIDNKLDEAILQQEKLSIPFVGPNNLTGAKSVGDHLASQLKAGDKVVVLEGIRTSFNATQRRLGFEQAMKEAGIEIVDSQSAQWEMNQANTTSAAMINEHPDIKAILAANDSMALGAVAAVKAANKGEQIAVVGFDNISAAQQAIRDGRMLATADQHGDQLAVFGIEFALKILQDSTAKMENRETPVDLVTAKELGLAKP